MPRTFAGVLVVVLSVGAVTTTPPTRLATADSQPPDAAATDAALAPLELPEGLQLSVEFPRYLMLERRLEAIIDNQSEVDVTVVDVALRSPLFEPVERDVHDYTVAARWRADLRMDVGASICPPTDGASMLEMTVEIDGERQHGVVEIDIDPIAKINTTECNEQYVHEHTDVVYGPDFDVVDGALTTTITLTRRTGDEPITLTQARGSVLFVIKPGESLEPGVPMAVMASGVATASAPISITVGRCEAHAVADAKKPYLFAAWISVGDMEPAFVTMTPDGEIKAALEVLLQECIALDDSYG